MLMCCALAVSMLITFRAPPDAQVAPGPVPGFIEPRHRGAVVAWLRLHPAYRVATDADCACAEVLDEMRDGVKGGGPPQPNYHPYYVIGDFNRDGLADFAVGFVDAVRPRAYVLVIFQQEKAKGFGQAFQSDFDRDELMFYGPPRPRPWNIVVGPYDSEGVVIRPLKQGYRISP